MSKYFALAWAHVKYVHLLLLARSINMMISPLGETMGLRHSIETHIALPCVNTCMALRLWYGWVFGQLCGCFGFMTRQKGQLISETKLWQNKWLRFIGEMLCVRRNGKKVWPSMWRFLRVLVISPVTEGDVQSMMPLSDKTVATNALACWLSRSLSCPTDQWWNGTIVTRPCVRVSPYLLSLHSENVNDEDLWVGQKMQWRRRWP